MFNAFLFFQLQQINAHFAVTDDQMHTAERTIAANASTLGLIAEKASDNTRMIHEIEKSMHDLPNGEWYRTQLNGFEIRLGRCEQRLGGR